MILVWRCRKSEYSTNERTSDGQQKKKLTTKSFVMELFDDMSYTTACRVIG